MRIRKHLITIALALIFSGPSWAQKSKSVLSSEIMASFPDQNTGAITPSVVRGVFNDFVNSWQQYIGINSQVGTSYSVVNSDYGQFVKLNNSGSITVTLPTPMASFLPFNTYLYDVGAGTATVSVTGGTINGSATLAITTGQLVWFIADGSGTNYIAFNATGAITTVANSDGTLTISPTTGNVVASLNLSHANIWAAAQTFTNSDLVLLGSSTGKTTFTSANAGASNYTLTVPAATDTIAELAASQAFTNKTYNGLTLSATTGTFTLTNAKTLTVNNSITIAGTDTTTMTFPSASATITQTIASGALTLNTTTINSATCSAAQTATATGTATTDAISASFNGDPTGATGYVPLTTGMLTIIVYPTLNTVNMKACNNTAASITPQAVTINWRVVR